MIFDKQTLVKCSLDQLRKYKQEHKEEMQKLVDEWFKLDDIQATSRKNADISWHVQACSVRIENILNAILDKTEVSYSSE